MKRTSAIIRVLIISISLFYGCEKEEVAKPPEPPAQAQEKLWNQLNASAMTLYQQGHYSEAVKLAKEALTVAEKTFGPDHPHVAQSLNNLATVYQVQGEYAEAEPLYKRALVIVEKALGPDHPHVAATCQNMAELYKKMGNKDEAEKLEAQAKKIRAKR